MQYRINGYDQIIEAENPYKAAYDYFFILLKIEKNKPYLSAVTNIFTDNE